MDLMALKIVLAQTTDDIKTCMAVRRRVFIEEQSVSEADEIDGQDNDCLHVLAFFDDIPAGAARFRTVKDYAKIQRVCVLADHRGRAIGADLIKFIVGYVTDHTTAHSVRLGAQTHALDFYHKLGFRTFGAEYLDAGISHKDMKLVLRTR